MCANSDAVVGIIPARLNSARLPGKPLADICGKSMICHVCERASKAVDQLFVATDSPAIIKEVESHGFKGILTSADCPNGTARVAEAARMLNLEDAIIVDIQGDEPLIEPSDINKVVTLLHTTPETDIATLAARFDPTDGFEALANPNRVKVVTDARSRALYFSRSVIPFVNGTPRDSWPLLYPYLIHTGLYAFRPGLLPQLASTPGQSPLELAESLEQLRWLQMGFSIYCAITDHRSIPVDTEPDLEAVRFHMASRLRK